MPPWLKEAGAFPGPHSEGMQTIYCIAAQGIKGQVWGSKGNAVLTKRVADLLLV